MGAARAASDGIAPSTSSKADTHWSYWLRFLQQIELSGDPFLQTFSIPQRHQLLSAFAQAIRDCTFAQSPLGNDKLVAGTCFAAVNNVAQAFEASGFPNPTLDAVGKKSFLLHRLHRGFKNLDGSTRHQKCISVDETLHMCSRASSCPLLTAFQQNYLLGFFFAMRSCENFKVSGSRRTCPIRLRNIFFWKNNVIIPHSSTLLESSDKVTVHFEWQKKDARDVDVTQSTTHHPFLCPVRAAASIVRRLQAFQAPPDSFVFTCMSASGKCRDVTGPIALQLLRAHIQSIDYRSLGISPETIGLHSCRSSAAMAMYLNHVPVYTIMLLGRWSSDAFLRYIRQQVTDFGSDVASKMIQTPRFYHVPPLCRDDPRSHNPLSFAANSGLGSGCAANRNCFSVWP